MRNYARFETNRSVEQADMIFVQRIKDAILIFEKYRGEFSTRPCPVCGESKYNRLDDFHERYGVSRCIRCATEYVNPAPSERALQDYYSNALCNRQLAEIYRRRNRSFNVDDRVRTVDRLSARLLSCECPRPVRVLEIGCSSGHFLDGLCSYLTNTYPGVDFSLTGIDIDGDAVKNSVNAKLDLRCQAAESMCEHYDAEGSFDLILHYELLEHLIDPFSFMCAVKTLLKPGGFCVFTTPNALGAENLATSYNSRRLIAGGIFPPMHLNAFSTSNLPLFAYRTGFNLFELTTPGKLDVDMITVNRDHISDQDFSEIANLDDEDIKALIQDYTSSVKASSHMHCILQKPY